MKILITAFGPFGSSESNSSQEAASLIGNDAAGDGVQIVKAELPVSFVRCHEAIDALIARHRPDAVVCLGQAAKRDSICIERIAVNHQHAATPDNDGNAPKHRKIIDGAPDGYFTGIDPDAAAAYVNAAGVPCRVSDSAGLYVCNTLLFGLRHRHPALTTCFVHLPQASAVAAPTMAKAVVLLCRYLRAGSKAAD